MLNKIFLLTFYFINLWIKVEYFFFVTNPSVLTKITLMFRSEANFDITSIPSLLTCHDYNKFRFKKILKPLNN